MENATIVSSDAPDVAVAIASNPPTAPTTAVETDTHATEVAARARDAETGQFVKTDEFASGKTQTPEMPVSETEPQSQPRRGSPEFRIGQAVKKQREAERRAAELEAQFQDRLSQYEARLADMEAMRASGYAPKPDAKPPRDPNEPQESQFDTYEAYIEARADYRAAKKAEEVAAQRAAAIFDERFAAEQQRRAEAAALRARQEVESKHHARIEQAIATHADYESVMEEAADAPVSVAMEDAILHSELGHEMMYYFGKNPAEAARIAKLPAGLALMEMGKLEARLSAAPETVPAPRVPVSSAPPPVRPVTGGAHTTAAPDLDSMSPAAYREYMNKRDRERARR